VTFLKGELVGYTVTLTKEPSGSEVWASELKQKAAKMDSTKKRVLIYFKAMARFHLAIATIATALFEILAQAKPLAICNILAPSDEADLEPYLKEGVYSKGLQLIKKGQGRRGIREITKGWKKVSMELSRAFEERECDKIKTVMAKYVFKEKPLAEVSLDRFVMPKSVRREVARALCTYSDLEEAGKMLLASGDVEDVFIAGLFFGFGGKSEACLAILSGVWKGCEKQVFDRVCRGDLSQEVLACFEGSPVQGIVRRLLESKKEEVR